MHGTSHTPHLFLDRRSAGLELAEALTPHLADRPLVLALPRGGVPVAFEVARMLRAELDILLVRRIGAPGHSGLALGAVIDGANPQFVINEKVMHQVRPPSGWFEEEMQYQLQELERIRRLYCSEPPIPLVGRSVILVDDGVDTGSSVRASLKGLAKSAPGQLILAVPIGPRETVKDLQPLVDELICLAMPAPFGSIGQHYADFRETTDQEVAELLAQARAIA